MLRGSYFESGKTIIIENLRLHHTFSLEIWAMWPTVSGTHTIFSKTREVVSNCDDTDKLFIIY